MGADVETETDLEEILSDEEKRFKCKYAKCGAAFRKRDRLKKHINIHKNNRDYKCTYKGCDKSYTSTSHLKRHIQKHTMVAKQYMCSICSVNMSTLSNLKRHHNRVHNSERELYCHECKFKFRKKNRYEEHMAGHSNTPIYKCEKCGKSFLTYLKFERHKQSHEQKNIYTCPVKECSQTFDKWALLIKHKKTDHILRYVCSKCDKKFICNRDLSLHKKVHIEERPTIPCPYPDCTHLYYFKRNLNQHIQNKHLGKTFHCDICNAKLSTKQKISEHMIKIHLTERKPFKRKQAQSRIDTGMAKRSILTTLTGIQLKVNAEVHLMQRNPVALLRDQAVEESSSYSEDDRASNISAK